MATQRNKVIIEVTDNGTIKRYTTGLKKAEKGTDQLRVSTTGLRRSLGALRNNLLLVSFAFGGAIAVITKMTNAFREVEKSTIALKGLTGSSQQASRWIAEIEKSTRGTVTQLGVVQAASRFAAMGLAETAEEAANLAEIAVVLGGAMGTGPTKAIEDFSLLLANSAILRLDTFGISASVVRTRIRELQAETKGLDRQTAFLMATMQEGQRMLSSLDDVWDSSAVKANTLTIAWNNLSIAIGEALNPADVGTRNMLVRFLDAATGALEPPAASVLDGQDNLLESFRQQAEALAKLQQEQDSLTHLYNQQIPLLKNIPPIYANIDANVEGAADSMFMFASSIRDIALAFDSLSNIKDKSGLQLLLAAANIGIGVSQGLTAFKTIKDFIPDFATGGDFMTNGPQLIMVGDNSSGRERVQITPDPVGGGGGGVTINITGTLISEDAIREELVPVLERVGFA